MKAESPYGNILEAFSVGATDAITLVAGIVANLIAFISLVILLLIWYIAPSIGSRLLASQMQSVLLTFFFHIISI